METEKLLDISFSDIERELHEVGHFLPAILKYSSSDDLEDDEFVDDYVDIDEDEDVKDNDVLSIFSGEIIDERETVDIGKDCAVEFGPNYLLEMEEEGNGRAVRAIKSLGRNYFKEYQDYFYLGVARTREVLPDCVKAEPLDRVYISRAMQAFKRNMEIVKGSKISIDLRWHRADISDSFLNWRDNMLDEIKDPIQHLAVYSGSFAVSIAYAERERDRRNGIDAQMPSSVK